MDHSQPTQNTKTHDIEKHRKVPTESYEYLVVVAEDTLTKLVPIPANKLPENVEEGHTKEWEFKVYIYWPNTIKPEIRSEDNAMLHTLFNEFGLDGWKLITNIVTYTAIFRYDRFGSNETGSPLGQKFIFIRRRNL